jgi:glycosyltransferase involved in cell wall biosynthesis
MSRNAASSAAVKTAIISTHVAPAKGVGGIAESVARLARAWADAGRSFSLCAGDASLGGPPLRREDVSLPAHVPVRLYRARLWPRFGFGLGAVAAIWRTCRAADTVFINGIGTWPTTLAQLCCLLLRRPMLVALHAGLMPAHVAIIRARKPHKWLFYRLLTLPALRRARAVHVTAPLEREGLDRLIPGVPVVEIPNGVDPRLWTAQPPRPNDGGPGGGGPNDDGLTLCYVGRLSPEKGILRFLRAWRRVRGPSDRFLIVGGGEGAYAAAVAQEAAQAGAAVELTGELDGAGVRAVLARADMLTLPSGLEDGDLRENFGNAAAEALACARPVLIPRGLAWDMAESEGFGVLFDPDDAGIADGIERARSLSPTERAAMGRRGRDYVERRLNIKDTAERLWRAAAACAAPDPSFFADKRKSPRHDL